MKKETQFYEFDQNNSGGRFVVDDKLCHVLLIEATNYKEAIQIAESLGCYWNGVQEGRDCRCCGDRWYPPWDESYVDLEELNEPHKKDKRRRYFDGIEQYAQYIANEYGWTKPDVRIYYLDGFVHEVFSKKVK
jgi:hypothetical protein